MGTWSKARVYKNKVYNCTIESALDSIEPIFVHEALTHPKCTQNKTLSLAPPSLTINVKKNPNGATNQYKACLIAKWFN